jgi:hypothetical protein
MRHKGEYFLGSHAAILPRITDSLEIECLCQKYYPSQKPKR